MKVGLVGYGLAGSVFHAPHINACEGLELSAIVSSRASEINKVYPHTSVLKDIKDLLGMDLDIIVIASPNDTHYEFAKMAIEKGCHVVVDKPFTPSLEQTQELINLAKKQNVLVTSFHNRRLDGDFLTIKKLIADKKLGDVKVFESNFNRFRPTVNKDNWRETTDIAGGVFYDLGPHLIDQALALFGMPSEVFLISDAMREGAKNSDFFKAHLLYTDKKVELNAHCFHASPSLRYKVLGNLAAYEKYGMDPQEARLRERAYHQENGVYLDSEHGILYSENSQEEVKTIDGNYLGFYENFQKAIKAEEDLLVKPIDIYNVQYLIEKLLESHEKKAVISLEDK